MLYICGPPPMIDAVEKILTNLGIKSNLIVKEEF
jgi:NAD(P)H-flavin reductase